MCCCCCSEEKPKNPPKKVEPQKSKPTPAPVVVQPKPSPAPQATVVPTQPAATPGGAKLIVASPPKSKFLDLLNSLESPTDNSNTIDLASLKTLEIITERFNSSIEKFKSSQKGSHIVVPLEAKLLEQRGLHHYTDPQLLDTQYALAQALIRYTGRYNDALRLSESSIELYEKILGRDHIKIISMHLLRAFCFLCMKNHEDALDFFQKVYDMTLPYINSKLVGQGDRWRQLNTQALGGIASAMKMAGRCEEAMEILGKVYANRLSRHGQFSLETLSGQKSMAKVLKKQGKVKEALILAQKAYRDLYKCHPPFAIDDEAIVSAEHFLGTLLRDEADPRIAFKILLEVYGKEVSVYGPNHPLTLSTLLNFGIIFEKVGNSDLALKVYEDAWEKRKLVLGEKHEKTLKAKKRLMLI